MSTTQKKSITLWLKEEFFTYCAFWIAVSTLPALALSYVVVRISKHLWLKLLSSRYPGLEFIRTDTVRSLLDTHRNQGIINVLLCIKGTPDIEEIKHQLTQHVIDRRDKDGDFMFPRLRQLLVSRWGNYAWEANVPFRTENHFMVANGVYRGRPVSDNNIQEYVSEIISKYFPSDQPPWQYIIIPCMSPETKFYILVRVHHLLLSGKKSLNIGDLLLVEQANPSRITQADIYESPLSKLYPTPSAIPELWGKLNENLSNAWNEFVSEYDPVESPRALKTLPGAFHVAGLVLISGVSAFRELRKKKSNGRDSSDAAVTVITLAISMQRECKRRNLTVLKMLISPLVTANPYKWPSRAINAALTSIDAFIKLPFRIYDEITALYDLKTTGQVTQAHTLTWKYAELAQLCVRASLEAWRGVVEVYRAPAKLWTDTIAADDGKKHLLQTVSLCGRKIGAWSRPIDRAGMERAARALGVPSNALALCAATEALRAFFEHANATPPDTILATARAASEDFLFTFAEGQGKEYKKSQTGGMICLSLPVGATPRRIASVVEQACKRQGALAGVWAAQARCGALTRAVPSPLAKLMLNVLSRRYAVSYAEINAPIDAQERKTLWGQVVDSVIYWRPPQANISMSLTVIQYADTIRLAVMTDARLSPAHTIPATRWPSALEQLINRVDQEIARIAAHTKTPIDVVPQIITPRELPERQEDPEANQQDQESTSTLKPPSATVVSPPPTRRRIQQ